MLRRPWPALAAVLALLVASGVGFAVATSAASGSTATCGAPAYDPATGKFDLSCIVPQATVTVTQTATPTPTTPPTTHINVALPARGTFSYPWFPEAWTQGGVTPASHYQPTRGYYNSVEVEQAQIQDMLTGRFVFDLSSWWGQGDKTDARFGLLLDAANSTALKVAPYYEAEGNTVAGAAGSPNPTSAQITSDLNYIATRYATAPGYMYVAGRPVIFAFGDGSDTCAMVDRWKAANAAAITPFYVVLKVFSGYGSCANQPDNWHQYAPAVAVDSQGTHSVTISPGFWKYNETSPRLARDLTRWRSNIATMNCSPAAFRLVTSFNEWGEGSAVESSTVWPTGDGSGQYLEELATGTTCTGPTTSPPPTTSSPPPTTTSPPTTSSPPPTGTIKVDAIADAGPSASNWISSLAAGVVADRPDLYLWAGDVRNTGTAAEWALWTANYGALKSVTLPTPGNHDWSNHATGYDPLFRTDPLADTTTWCNGISKGGWGFFSINSFTLSSCLPKLTAWLNATPGTRKIVLTHEPRWSGGSGHGSSTAIDPIWAAMKGHAFMLVSGHDHDVQVIENSGMVQLVNGCAGASYYTVSPIAGTDYYSRSASDCTYTRLTLGASTAQVQQVRASGAVAFSKTFPVS